MKKRITPLQYAIFLYQATLAKNKREIEKIAKEFLGILVKNNDLGEINDILKEFEIYEKKQKGIKDAEIISAKMLAGPIRNQIVDAMKSSGNLAIEESVDPGLLGGLVLVIGDMMIDGSLRKKLRELNEALA